MNPFEAYDLETRRLTREFEDKVRAVAQEMLPEIQRFMTSEIVRLFKQYPGFESFYFTVPLRDWMKYVRGESRDPLWPRQPTVKQEHWELQQLCPQLDLSDSVVFLQALRYLNGLHTSHAYVGILMEDYEYGSPEAIDLFVNQ